MLKSSRPIGYKKRVFESLWRKERKEKREKKYGVNREKRENLQATCSIDGENELVGV